MRNNALWLVAAACFGPLLLAYILYFGPFNLRPDQLAGSRELLDPPVVLPERLIAVSAEEIASGAPDVRWSLLYVRAEPCDEPCLIAVDRLHRVHLAIGDDADRVQRIYFYTQTRPQIADDPTLLLRELRGEDEALIEALGAERAGAARVYIADPLGNVVAAYPPDIEMQELLRDIERLLRVSRIG